MNRLLCAASLFALAVPSAALAQDHGNKNHGGGDGQPAARPQSGGGQHAARPQHGGAPAQAPAGRPGRPVAEHMRTGPSQAPAMQAAPQRPGRPVANERVNVRTTGRPGPGGQVQMTSRAGRTVEIRRYRAPAYRYPSGYSYRRWNIGLVLPSIFLTNYYFYNSWSMVGAYPPPPGFVWVRYGPDLLLVSRRSGRIRDVIYGVFY